MTSPDETPYRNEIIQTLAAQEYELLEEIGHGGYATVFKVLHRRYDQIFCVKVMYLLDEARLDKIIQSYQSEISSLMNLEHPNIIHIYNHFSSAHCYYIILEYCPNGSLHDLIERDPPKGWVLQDMMKQILSAMAYCHAQHLCHRDIKPHNILIDKYGRLKLADFGLAKMFETKVSAKKCGSLCYMAPELVAGYSSVDPFACDIWALGITFYEMAFGCVPWVGRLRDQIQKEIITGSIGFPQNGDPLVFVLRKMLCVEANRRAPLTSILQMPFFSDDSSGRISLQGSKGNVVFKSSCSLTIGFPRRSASLFSEGDRIGAFGTRPGTRKLAMINRKWTRSCSILEPIVQKANLC